MNIGIVFFSILFLFLLFMAVTIVISLFRKEESFDFEPELSVIIPCYNEEDNIIPCLSSVIASDYPSGKYEIIVADDGSADRTKERVRIFMEDNKSYKIRLLSLQHGGKSAALNKAISESKKEIFLTLDADTTISKNCIREMVCQFKRKEVGAVNGISLTKEPKNILERFQQVEYYYNNLVRVGFTKLFDSGIWFFGASACYRRNVFGKKEEIFSGTLTEDMDISLKITERGYKVLTSSRAVSFTKAPDKVMDLFRQRMRWWFGVLEALVKNRKVLKEDPNPSIIFLYVNQFWWSFYSIFSLPLFIYQIIYWLPNGQALDVVMYFVRWFSLIGPVYVLYKIPEWGLSLLNIFGVLSGLISTLLIFASFSSFRKKPDIYDLLAIVFYFPYTILINLIIFASLIKYLPSQVRSRKFID